MKKTLLFGLLSMVTAIVASCQGNKNEPYNGWHYTCQIYIDSTVATCDVDSVVLNLPWLRNKIEQAVADTAVISSIKDWDERRACKGTMLEVYQYRDNITNAYYFAFIDHRTDTVVYNYKGNTIEQHYEPNPPDCRTIADINIGWYWWAPI